MQVTEDEIFAMIAKSRANAKKAMICSGLAIVLAITAVVVQVVGRFL